MIHSAFYDDSMLAFETGNAPLLPAGQVVHLKRAVGWEGSSRVYEYGFYRVLRTALDLSQEEPTQHVFLEPADAEVHGFPFAMES